MLPGAFCFEVAIAIVMIAFSRIDYFQSRKEEGFDNIALLIFEFLSHANSKARHGITMDEILKNAGFPKPFPTTT